MPLEVTYNVREIDNLVRKLGELSGKLENNTFVQLLRKAEKEIEKMLRQTTGGWTHQVNYDSSISKGRGSAVLTFTIDDEAWVYLTLGTRPHPIAATNAPMLVFSESYIPKTRPRAYSSGSGGPTGATVFASLVFHPGTEARDWHEMIIEDLKKFAEEWLKDEISRLIRGIA